MRKQVKRVTENNLWYFLKYFLHYIVLSIFFNEKKTPRSKARTSEESERELHVVDKNTDT
jgi:hypothetical protein